jgi:cathepsin L
MRFWKWAIEHGRNYQSADELEHRFMNFMRTEAEVEVLNSLGHDATYAVNSLSDYTKEEYRQLLGYIPEEQDEFDLYETESDYSFEESVGDNSLTVDWRAKGAVTGVKDQG